MDEKADYLRAVTGKLQCFERGKKFMKIDLAGKAAVVTGGGGILAGCMAKGFARCGATVAILDMRLELAKKRADEIKAAGGSAIAVECDVLNKKSMIAAEKKVYDELGNYHILLNGAGGNRDNATITHERFCKEAADDPAILSFFSLAIEDFESTMDPNFMGTLIPTQVFLKRMVDVKGASIINISSMTAFVPLTRSFAYGMGKTAINSLTQFLAMHFGNTGLRVNAIAPGFIATPMNRHMLIKEDGSFTDRGAKVVEHTPLARFADPEELVGAALFLADEKYSGFITGVVLPVDGGFLAAPGV